MFAPEVVEAAARELHDEIVAAWTADDHRRLAGLVGHELFVEWDRRLAELRRRHHRNLVERRGRLRVDYVGLVNRPGDVADHVVVHVRGRLRDAVVDQRGQVVFRDANDNGKRTRSEYWTLGKREGHWVLVSVEEEHEGAYHLNEPIVASPADDEQLHDEAVIERGVAAAAQPDRFAEVAVTIPLEFADKARLAALDVAQLDGRWAPDVLEAAARRAVAAWAEAIDGNHQSLIDIAGRHTANALLYPGSDRRTRQVIRGAELLNLRIIHLEPAAKPPTMTVEATIRAHRYTESRSTGAVLEGSKTRTDTFSEQWDLILTHNRVNPWRIASRHQPRVRPFEQIRRTFREITNRLSERFPPRN
jgi:predicted lipid-binding transport protein (Tim44 family)